VAETLVDAGRHRAMPRLGRGDPRRQHHSQRI